MKRGFIRCLSVLVLICLCTGSSFALAGMDTDLHETEWSWEPLNVAVFEGTVTFDEVQQSKLLLRLSFTTVPEGTEPGEVVFQTVNGKKLTIRKQKSEYVFEPGDLTEFTFTGNWKTPEDVYFSRVSILFQVYDENGKTLLAEEKLDVIRDASDTEDSNGGKFRITADLSSWTLWLALTALIVWTAAVVRIILNNKHKTR